MNGAAGALCLAAVLASASPALAHHSFAAYDSAKTVTLNATVQAFEWANPHAAIRMLVQDDALGAQAQWEVETSSPSILQRFGWRRKSIKRGDHVIVLLNPMRDGSHHGRLHTLTVLETGQILRTKLSGP